MRIVLLAAAACASDTDGEDTESPDAPLDTDDPTEPPTPEDTDVPPPPTEPCPVYVEIGSGEFTFVELEPLDQVEMVHGPQGGWHILWSVILSGTEPTAQLRGIITDVASDVVVSDITYNVKLDPVDECSGESIGQYGYLDVSGLASGSLDTPPELLVGNTLVLRVEAADFAGTATAGEVLVTAAPDPGDVD
jgi:hypothetical protein